MPNGASASTMALMTVGVEPIVPASPMPLTPSGLVGLGRHRVVEPEAGDLGCAGHAVVDQRGVAQQPVVVVDRLLPQRLGDALHDAAVELALDDHRVDLGAAVVDRGVVEQLDTAGLLVDLDDRHVGPEREHEVGRVVGAPRRPGSAPCRRAGCGR